MFDKVKVVIEKKSRKAMIAWLQENKVEHLLENVVWYTTGHEADATELDIWVDGWFVQAFYDDTGNLTHYEIEEND